MNIRKILCPVLSFFILLLWTATSWSAYGGIVLALSGGGTRGFAHVGVLRVLEENKIPVVGIVGTSMGSIIGGVASCGYTADEIEEIVMALDLRTLLYDRSQPSLSPLGTEDYSESMTLHRIYLNDKGETVGPLGGLSGHRLLEKLEEITYPYSHVKDFRKLPIPFAAVTTDLYEGNPFVIRGGSLAEAMRASMSIPGLFQPWQMDGRLLVDGGLVANLPVTIAKEVFPGYPVLAVDISSAGKKPGKIRSIVDVLDQSINIMTARDLERERNRADLVIRPEVGNLPMLSTSGFSSIISAGETGARKEIDRIRHLAANAPAVPKRTNVARRRLPEEDRDSDLSYSRGHEDVKYEALFGGYYSSFHNRNYLFSNFLTRNFLEDDDILLSQILLGREWGLRFAYQDAGLEWRQRSEYAFSIRHRDLEPSNAPSTSWERYALEFTERTMVNDMRAGIGLVGEYFTVDSGEDEGHAGPKAYLIYNTLDDMLDPTRGFYVRTDLYWRDLDSLLGRMEFKGVTGIGGSRTRMLLQGGFFAGDDRDPYSRAYLGAREELHSLADSPLSGENAAWWKTTIRRVLTESWWGTINADLFFSQGYLLDNDLNSLEDPWEWGLGFSIPGSLLNATVFAVYTDEDEWDFGATIGLPVKNTPFGP